MEIFNRSQQRIVLFLIACALSAFAILVWTHIQREKALSNIELIHSAFEICSEEIIPEPIDINTASFEELKTLPRIGTVSANKIIEYRKIYGRFNSIEEITRVKGIGKKTFEKIREAITVGSSSYCTAKKSFSELEKPESLPERMKSIMINEEGSMTIHGSKTFQEQLKININTASIEELDRLHGIGPAIANRIIEYRKFHGGFQSIEEITRVKGIGVKTYEKIKGSITIASCQD